MPTPPGSRPRQAPRRRTPFRSGWGRGARPRPPAKRNRPPAPPLRRAGRLPATPPAPRAPPRTRPAAAAGAGAAARARALAPPPPQVASHAPRPRAPGGASEQRKTAQHRARAHSHGRSRGWTGGSRGRRYAAPRNWEITQIPWSMDSRRRRRCRNAVPHPSSFALAQAVVSSSSCRSSWAASSTSL